MAPRLSKCPPALIFTLHTPTHSLGGEGPDFTSPWHRVKGRKRPGRGRRVVTQGYDFLDVRVIHVSIHPEKTLVYIFQPCFEVFRKRHPELRWEDSLIIELLLHPGHQVVHVLWCRALNWLLDGDAISLPRPPALMNCNRNVGRSWPHSISQEWLSRTHFAGRHRDTQAHSAHKGCRQTTVWPLSFYAISMLAHVISRPSGLQDDLPSDTRIAVQLTCRRMFPAYKIP